MLLDAFDRVRRDRPRHLAIHGLSENRTLTIEALAEEAGRVAEAFGRARIPDSRPLVTLIGNRTAFVSTLLACVRRRMVMVPLDGDSTLPEAVALAERFQAPALVVRPQVDDRELPSSHVRFELPNGLSLIVRSRDAAGAAFGDAMLFKLTSGSTSAPRAVMATEGNMVADGEHITAAMDIRPDDVNLAAIPLSHSYGLGNLVMPLLLQGTSIVLRDAFSPPRLFEDIRACGATVLPGVPFMFDYIRRHLQAERFPPAMRVLITAGARIDGETVSEFHRLFGLKIHSFYGTSETGGIAYDDSPAIGPITMGHPLPGVGVSFREAPGAVPGEGRLHVRGAAVTCGYAGDPESTRESFVDGGYLTGDIGMLDADGRLFLTGRVSRFVNVAGRKVHPQEVARVLLEYAGVSEAKVFGIPDPVRGQALVACVVADPDRVDVLGLRRHCAAHLSPYKIPRQLVILRALPVDARGKTDHRALEALVSRELER
jgi:long-chain acyl-CoA synthetase